MGNERLLNWVLGLEMEPLSVGEKEYIKWVKNEFTLENDNDELIV